MKAGRPKTQRTLDIEAYLFANKSERDSDSANALGVSLLVIRGVRRRMGLSKNIEWIKEKKQAIYGYTHMRKDHKKILQGILEKDAAGYSLTAKENDLILIEAERRMRAKGIVITPDI